MITITKEFNFSAAHHLPNHEGLCHNFHGHNYKLFVTISSPSKKGYNTSKKSPEYGMIMDFSKLKKIVTETIINKYDHQLLNQFFSNPTAEMMICDIAKILQENLRTCKLVALRLYETDTSYAEWTR